jgi:hypothetical protein
MRTRNYGHLDHDTAVRMGFRTIFAPGAMIYSFVEETVTSHAPMIVLREIKLKFKNHPLYAPSELTVICQAVAEDGIVKTLRVIVRDDSGLLATGQCRILERK